MELPVKERRNPAFLSSTALRILACLTMLMDHVGYIYYSVFPYAEAFRAIGRLSFPIFAFLIAEGYRHTRSVKAYALRLLLAALITEPLLDRCFLGSWYVNTAQNSLFTLLLGLFAIHAVDCLRKNESGFLSFLPILLSCLAAIFYKTDYGYWGVLTVVCFYFFQSSAHPLAFLGIPAFLLLCCGWPFLSYRLFSLWPESWIPFTKIPLLQTLGRNHAPSVWEGTKVWAFAASVPLLFYNGKSGMPKAPFTKKALRFFFYSFYPLHLLVLILLQKNG